MKQKRSIPHLAIELVVLLLMALVLLRPVQSSDYRRFVTDTLHYVRGTVLEVVTETLTDSTLNTGQKLGEQELRVRLSDGQEVTVTNYLTDPHNILLKVGDSAIICADMPENAMPYYTVYSYDRMLPLLVLFGLFAALLIFVGRRKGLDACLAIAFTLLFILRVTLPLLYNGGSPVLIGLMTVLLSTAVSLVLLHGASVQCVLGIATTSLGELAACVLFAIFSAALHLTGFQTGSAESLLLIAQRTGLQIRTVLFAGMMIASLGAVMDVAVSVLSALREISLAAETAGRAFLFKSGMSMGRDMISTMSNTLIFAFTGGSLASMLVLFSYGVSAQQLFHSDYLALELAQGLCSTAAVILTVPAAAMIGAAYYGSLRRKGK